MSTEQNTEKQPKKRIDPAVQRPTGGMLLQGQLDGKKPGLAYRLANPNDQMFGAPFMETMGWSYVSDKSGERIRGGQTQAGKWYFVGQVLMCRPVEDEEADLAYKHSFVATQEADKNASENHEFGMKTVPVTD